MARRLSLHVFDSLPSTLDSILELGATEAPEGTTHIAREQTHGRGRAEHTWWSPPDAGLWMSTLLRPARSRALWGGISLVAGRAVERALGSLGVPEVEVYWPNDLEIRRRKVGGILGEVRAQGDRAWIALGIGINIDLRPVRASMPPELRSLATSLAENGPIATRDPRELAGAILREFFALYDRFESGEDVPTIVGESLAHRGRAVTVRVPGQAELRGRVAGLGPAGELLVAPAGGGQTAAITAGEVIYEAGA